MAKIAKSSSKKSSTSSKNSVKKSTKKSAKKSPRKVSSRRELIDTGVDKRYVRRNKSGEFKESDDVSRSLSADRRRKARTTAGRGQGDRGD